MKLFMALATAALIGLAIYLFIATHRHGKNEITSKQIRKGSFDASDIRDRYS